MVLRKASGRDEAGRIGFEVEELELDVVGIANDDDVPRLLLGDAGVGDTQKVAFNPVGQVVGQLNEVESCRQVIFRLINEYVDALDRVNSLMPEEA